MSVPIWPQAVETVVPHVVRISTPHGSGSGFLVANGKSNLCGIATAAHVIDHANYWEEPIRIDHVFSGTSLIIRRDERAIFLDSNRDTAVILLKPEGLSLPENPLPLAPKDKYLKMGNPIAWLGFPAIPLANLCFFSGSVSAWLEPAKAYFVDGVAINGVSGGPAFHLLDSFPVLVGVVSAYYPNLATNQVLPGLSMVRDVSQLHEVTQIYATLEQAKEAEPPAEPPTVKQDEHAPSEITTRLAP